MKLFNKKRYKILLQDELLEMSQNFKAAIVSEVSVYGNPKGI